MIILPAKLINRKFRSLKITFFFETIKFHVIIYTFRGSILFKTYCQGDRCAVKSSKLNNATEYSF